MRQRSVANELAQASQGLDLGHAGGTYVRLELQQLQLDLQVVAFTDVSGFITLLADRNCVLKAVQVFQRKLQRGIRQQHIDELLRNIKDQRALGIGHLGCGNGRCIASSPQAVLAFVSALKEIAQANIKLLKVVQRV